jgi:hypothetical protein
MIVIIIGISLLILFTIITFKACIHRNYNDKIYRNETTDIKK